MQRPGEPERDGPRHDRILQQIIDAAENAAGAVELYRFALGKLVPAVGASFGSVYIREADEPGLLKLACTHNWPQPAARYLGEMRVRVGRGPTGRAVAEGRAVEVQNVFADAALNDWWQPARELGFASLISLPLRVGGQIPAALSFYFAEPRRFSAEDRALLRLAAEQVSRALERQRTRVPPDAASHDSAGASGS